MRKLPALLIVPCLLVVGACGRSAGGSSATSAAPTSAVAVTPAGGPSKQAQMICIADGQREIAAALSMTPTAPVVPQWVAPDYSCRYVYRTGSFRMVVRDLPDKPATLAYFALTAARHGRRSTVNIGADEAFLLNDGSLVARKDRHVLLVDVSGLPAQFGTPPMPRDQVAYSLGGVIMSCWTGDAS